MAKIFNLIAILLIIQVALWVYDDQTPPATAPTLNATSDATLPLWQIATNNFDWNGLEMIKSLILLAGTLGVGLIIIGVISGIKTDFMVFAPLVGVFLAFGYVIAGLGNVILRDTAPYFGCAEATITGCLPATFIIVVTTGLFAVYYVLSVIDWWRGRDN